MSWGKQTQSHSNTFQLQ